MSGALFQPLLQHLGHYPADRLLTLAAAKPDCLNQLYRQIDREHSFWFGQGSQLQPALCLEQVTVRLAARKTALLDEGSQNGLRGSLSPQPSDRHIDSLCLCGQ